MSMLLYFKFILYFEQVYNVSHSFNQCYTYSFIFVSLFEMWTYTNGYQEQLSHAENLFYMLFPSPILHLIHLMEYHCPTHFGVFPASK